MNSILKKFWDLITFEDYEEEDRPSEDNSPVISPEKKGKLEIHLFTLQKYDDVVRIAAILKEHMGVIADLSRLSQEDRKRAIDTVCGTIYALNGNLQKITEHFFFFAPSQVSFHVEKTGTEEEFFGKE